MFRSVTFIQQFWELPKRRYPMLALMSSRQLVENGDVHCWYAEMQQWFESHGMSINALPPFQYSLDSPHLNMTKVEKNRVIQTDIINLENKIIPQKRTFASSLATSSLATRNWNKIWICWQDFVCIGRVDTCSSYIVTVVCIVLVALVCMIWEEWKKFLIGFANEDSYYASWLT